MFMPLLTTSFPMLGILNVEAELRPGSRYRGPELILACHSLVHLPVVRVCAVKVANSSGPMVTRELSY